MIVVTGLPGSGTTLLMRMLEAGGVPVLHEPDHHPADARHPHGRYEIDLASFAPSQSTSNHAVKIVDVDFDCCPAGEHKYLIATRDCREIAESLSVTPAEAWGRQAALIDRCHPAVTIHYSSAILRPDHTTQRITTFLGGNLDAAAMRAAIDPSLWHHRAVQ